mgnify:CR=1 FL=1
MKAWDTNCEAIFNMINKQLTKWVMFQGGKPCLR